MLTPAQLQTLKTNILATPEAAQLLADGSMSGLADYYNTTASPAFTVWRTSVDVGDIMSNGFDWTRVDNASVGKARIWEWMMQQGTINPSKANIRAGIDQAWDGAADNAHRAGIYVHCKRLASRIEKLFATGTGSDASPALAVVIGPVDVDVFVAVRDLP